MAFVKLGIALDYKKALADYNELLTKMGGKAVDLKVNIKSSKAVAEIVDKNTTAIKGYQASVEKATVSTNKLGDSVEKVAKKGKPTLNFFQELGRTIKHNISEMAQWGIAGTAIFGTMRKIGEAVEYVTEMDTALVNIRMASGMTREETQGLAQDYLNLGKELGIAVEEIANSATELYRQGLNTEEVNARLGDFIKLSKVLGRDLQSTIEIGTAGTTAFGVTIQKLGDVASAVGDATASSGDEIMVAIQKAGMSAQTAGVSLEELSAMAATISSTTRESGAIVGNSLKSILAKLSQVDDLTGEINDDYGKTLKRLSDMGIAIEDQSGNLLDATGILENVGLEWDNLTAQQQKYLASGFGVYQLNRFQALVKGMTQASGEYSNNLETAYKSMGATATKYEEYADSIEAATARMGNEWKELFTNILTSENLIKIVNLGASFIDLADKTNVLTVAVTGLIAVITGKAIQSFVLWIASAGGVTAALASLLTPMGLLIGAVVAVSAVIMSQNYAVNKAKEQHEAWARQLAESKAKQKESREEIIRTMQSLSDLENVTELSASQNIQLTAAYEGLAKILPQIKSLIDENTLSYNSLAEAALLAAKMQQLADIQNLSSEKKMLSAEKKMLSDEISGTTYYSPYDFDQVQKKANETGADAYNEISRMRDSNARRKKLTDDLVRIKKDETTIAEAMSEIESLNIAKGDFVPDVIPSKGGTDVLGGGDSKSTPHIDPLDSLQSYRDAVDAVTLALAALDAEKASASDEEMVGILERENEQYELRKKALAEYGIALDEQASKLNKNSETYQEDLQKIQDEHKKIGLDWWENEKAIQANIKSIKDLRDKIIEANKKIAEEQKKTISELKEMVQDYIKSGIEEQKDAEQDLIDYAKEQLELKLKQIEAEEDLRDFTKDRAELEEDISQYTNKINKLKTAASQGDAKAQAELLTLQDQRSEAEEQLDELVHDRSVENTKEMLEEEYDLYEQAHKDRIEAFEDELKNAGLIAKRADSAMNDYLKGTSTTLYQNLIDWNSKYGTGMDADVINKWKEAITLLQQYNSTLGGSGFTFAGAQASLDAGVEKASIISQMKYNSSMWASADATERQRLNDENRRLASSIGYTYNPSDGKYYPSDPSAGKTALYDNGGLKPKGTVGILGENVKEWVFDDAQLKAVQQMAISDFISSPTFSGGKGGVPSVSINIEGSITDDNLTKITNEMKDIITKVSQGQLNSFRQRGVKTALSTR